MRERLILKVGIAAGFLKKAFHIVHIEMQGRSRRRQS